MTSTHIAGILATPTTLGVELRDKSRVGVVLIPWIDVDGVIDALIDHNIDHGDNA